MQIRRKCLTTVVQVLLQESNCKRRRGDFNRPCNINKTMQKNTQFVDKNIDKKKITIYNKKQIGG